MRVLESHGCKIAISKSACRVFGGLRAYPIISQRSCDRLEITDLSQFEITVTYSELSIKINL